MNQSTPNLSSQPTFRSGAVARQAGMPVATLRIWEQRYHAVGPTTAPSGHRLYSAADVERVVLLRQLTQQGHAIGSVAGLTEAQLQDLVSSPSRTEVGRSAEHLLPGAPFRIVVVGLAMAQRLQRPSVMDRWAQPPQLMGAFESLQQATSAAASAGTESDSAPIDLLLWHAASLQDGAAQDMQAAQKAWQARDVAVCYRFASPKARDALVSAGVSVAREPADDGALVAWLSSFQSPVVLKIHANNVNNRHSKPAAGTVTDPKWLDTLVNGAATHPLPRRRFDDTALTEFAGLSSSVACECPAHVAELLMQIASFEIYSASCASLSAADTELHHYLQRVAGTARVLFESALDRVAAAEGLTLRR